MNNAQTQGHIRHRLCFSFNSVSNATADESIMFDTLPLSMDVSVSAAAEGGNTCVGRLAGLGEFSERGWPFGSVAR
jgi:hypothetical protein